MNFESLDNKAVTENKQSVLSRPAHGAVGQNNNKRENSMRSMIK